MTTHDRHVTIGALKRALPYIRLHKGKLFVIKIGGAVCDNAASLRDLFQQIGVLRELGIRLVVVHGGGPQTTAMQEKLGLSAKFIDGRRVTDEKTLEVAILTMNGGVNTAILAACRAVGLPAVGLSGVDAGLVRATKRPPQTKVINNQSTAVDYGWVGDIVGVDATVIQRLHEAQIVPVISPLAADESGQVLNINADTIAATLARELKADKLIFLGEVMGILEDKKDPTSLISYTDVRGLNALVERGVVDGGMLPKINAAKDALYGGVKRVHVIGASDDALLVEVFTNEGAGTLIVMEMKELLPAEVTGGAP